MKGHNLTSLAVLALCVPLAGCSANSTFLDTSDGLTPAPLPRVSVDTSGAQWAPEPEHEFRNVQCDLSPAASPAFPSQYGLTIPEAFTSNLESRADLTFPEAPDGMWWEQSAPIGSSGFGPAITAGHVDYAPGALSPEGGELSPWGNLHTIDECTHVFATDAQGVSSEYVITSKYTVAQDDIASTGILDPAHPSNLILITCSGRTLEEVGAEHQFTYEYNLILEATLIPTTA